MAESVCVGVVADTEPGHLLETLGQLARQTDPGVSVVLLPDGPDPATAEALAGHAGLAAYQRWGTSEPEGGAACLNRLAARSGADVVVLLENGALVGPGWLELLLGALRRPGCGLAGPSTNWAWNEQAVFPRARGHQADVRRVAGEALRRYGWAARSLEPLYSLADFCYAVRREVLDATGGADEGYGQAPCWEMDLNIRAARAGYSGLWASGAYVYRAPLSARRRATEDRLTEAGKQRYQDRLCGLRLAGRTDQYRPHCEGDACQHFAPRELVTPQKAPGETARDETGPAGTGPAGTGPAGTGPAGTGPGSEGRSAGPPLVSCIMPTKDRPEFALQAVRYFQRQDWPATELIIVEDGPTRLADLLPEDPRITLVRSAPNLSIGGKRNLACELAQGEIIAQWDDDDWYAPERLSRQVEPIAAGHADITALRHCVLFEIDRWRFWRWSDDLHRRMLVRDVFGGTLVFRRQVWETHGRYPDQSLAEDAAFLDRAVRRRARLSAVSAAGLYVYVRHQGNSWRFDCGRTMSPPGWHRVDEPAFLAEDLAFYRQRSLVAEPDQAVLDQAGPAASARPVALSGADG